MGNVNCLNPWDVQSKHIMSVNGVAETLYSGECRYGGGEAYVLYEMDSIVAMNEREMSMMITFDIANTLTATDYKGCQLICYESH